MKEIESTLAELEQRDIVPRIWRRDHTVWKPQPDEISDRLGWLDIAAQMREQVSGLKDFAEEVRPAGFRKIVLLGMGGSSLGPLVLSTSLGPAAGFPELEVLDSTVPSAVTRVTESIDPANTFFLVSSKSGGTVEPNMLYKHFRSVVEAAVGTEHAGHSFAAITDEGSSLESLAHEQGFRSVFLNPSDIGGRYSVLSYFGMVPAALMGLDLVAILVRGERMAEACASGVPAADNPGARLGAAMGAMALEGRDKLTLVTSPSIATFGLWVEQLIAESTGKEGRGIVPVAGEPVLGPDTYGDDRLFVYLRLEGDDNAGTDGAVEVIEASGQPIVRLELTDLHDLGAEFFRWEFATAVAGSILGVNPFDQPDVEMAKKQTERALEEYKESGALPKAESELSPLEGLLSRAQPGDYLAIMAYLDSAPETEGALQDLRTAAMEQHHIATTVGYGPRFLHSTGQLHKGGPEHGLFLQLTADHPEDVPIRGEPYTFGVLADSQALGDLMSLKALGRPVARVHLGPDVAEGIVQLAGEVRSQVA